MKNLIITYKTDRTKRGAYNLAQRLSAKYPNILDYIQESDVISIKDCRKIYNKIIYNFQTPRIYNKEVFIYKDVIKYQDILFIRNEQSNSLYNSFSNGFSYWKQSKNIKYYFPIITFNDNFLNKNKEYDNPIIGIYHNVTCIDEVKFYRSFIADNSKYNFLILGHNFIFDGSVLNTYDEIDFFRKITHFLYIPSHNVMSPFPNVLLEAVLSNVIPIVLGLKFRPITDGVTDICSVINYLNTFNINTYIDNQNCILHPDNFDKFYNNNLLEFNGFYNKENFKVFEDFLNKL